jgi:hypothetical protein
MIMENASKKSLIEAFLENYVKPKLTNESPLDKPILVTRFRGLHGKVSSAATTSLRQLAIDVTKPKARKKTDLPNIKLARFGNVASESGCLRTNDNMRSISGVEADYDKGEISPREAVQRLKRAGVAGLIYTTPSHSPEEPRWRVLCPCSRHLPISKRRDLVARLNGLFDGQLDPHSFTPSQPMFIGRTLKGADIESHLAEGDFIDRATHLDAGAVYPGGERKRDPHYEVESAERMGLSIEQTAAMLEGVSDWKHKRENWFRVMCAVHYEHQGSEEAWRVFDKWCQGAANYKQRRNLYEWNKLDPDKPGGITMASINEELLKRDHPAAIRENVADLFDDLDDETDQQRGLTFLSPAECANTPRREYLIKGLLAKRDVGCIFGAPGAGKSLLAPYLGYIIAQGRSAFGMKTKQGGVFYVAAEDETGMCERIAALRLKHGDESNFTLVCGVSDLLSRNSKQYAELKAAVAERKPSLIVIDTLAMAFPGLEENSAEAMSRVVAVARSLTKFGAAVLLIHHDTKAEGGTPRGHSVVNGALDMAMHVTQDDKGIVRGKLTKNRNGPCDLDIAFRIGVVEIGTDEDGEPRKSAVCEPLAALDEDDREQMSPSERAAFDILTGMMDSPSGVNERDWRDACVRSRSVSAAEKYDSRLKAFKRAAEGLTRKKWVEFSNDKYLPRNSSERRIIRSFEELDDDEII